MAESKDAEFRGACTPSFLKLVDACAQAEGKSRMEWATPFLEAEAKRQVHAATVLLRMLRVDPTAPEGGSE